jgi:hypothetical protein
MKRREFVGKVGVGSAAAVAALAGGALAKTPGAPIATNRETERHDREHDHDDRPVKGALATATVSFGQWRTDLEPTSLDRYPPPPVGPPPGNGHKLIPHQVTIKVGGTVNFIIGGLHQVIVYAPGKRPDDVKTSPAFTRPTKGAPPAVPLINDPEDRLYAGLDPSTLHGGPPTEAGNPPLLDRVEVVQFFRKGRHLVICGVLPHFVTDKMYGWVKVVGDDDDED